MSLQQQVQFWWVGHISENRDIFNKFKHTVHILHFAYIVHIPIGFIYMSWLDHLVDLLTSITSHCNLDFIVGGTVRAGLSVRLCPYGYDTMIHWYVYQDLFLGIRISATNSGTRCRGPSLRFKSQSHCYLPLSTSPGRHPRYQYQISISDIHIRYPYLKTISYIHIRYHIAHIPGFRPIRTTKLAAALHDGVSTEPTDLSGRWSWFWVWGFFKKGDCFFFFFNAKKPEYRWYRWCGLRSLQLVHFDTQEADHPACTYPANLKLCIQLSQNPMYKHRPTKRLYHCTCCCKNIL